MEAQINIDRIGNDLVAAFNDGYQHGLADARAERKTGKMYDELIGNLRAKATHFHFNDETSLLLCKAADAIEELEKENEKLHDDLGKAIRKLTTMRWIPVTERLPDHRTTCLIVDDGVVVVGWRNLIGEWYDVAGDRLKYVTHWMPLSEPPESDGE